MADVKFLSTARRTGAQLPLDVQAGRTQRHQQNMREVADADFDYPRPPMTLGNALMMIAIMLASASVVVGLIFWFVEELAK